MFHFAAINDLHYLAPEDKPWLEALVRKVNAIPNLSLVLVLGDLAEDGKLEELAAAKSILASLRVPYHVVPGNHDGPPNRPIDGPDPGLANYESLFPNSRNYTFTHQGWQFLALDTTNGSGWKELPIPSDTMSFARFAAATLNPDAPTILFTHMPLDPAVPFSSSDGYELLDILRPLNLRIVLSGHFHGITESVAPPPNPAHLKLITCACCSRARELHDGTTRRGYYRCTAHDDQSVSYTFVEFRGI